MKSTLPGCMEEKALVYTLNFPYVLQTRNFKNEVTTLYS